MLASIKSAALSGIDAHAVDVEVDVSDGLPVFTIVGLPDMAVRESRERIQAAFKNSGLTFPVKRITVNLAPADIRKSGTAFDLPISLALLSAVLTSKNGRGLSDTGPILATGELALDGSLRPVRGILSIALLAERIGAKALLLPAANCAEAAVVVGARVVPLTTLKETLEWLAGRIAPIEAVITHPETERPGGGPDLSDIKGQAQARRALEVAAAGGHNLLLIGPPGAGKTMLARRIPTILPGMTMEEAMITTRIHSVAGRLPQGRSLLMERPFRAPHHTISDAGLTGGGTRAQPGELSLAHNGVLFLDELPEFRRHALEALRQPLEEGSVVVTRAMLTVRYPAAAMVVAAMNPCPCGKLGDPRQDCRCTDPQKRAYRSRLSGPLLDRFDLQVEVPALAFEEISGVERGELSAAVRERVVAARNIQAERFRERSRSRAGNPGAEKATPSGREQRSPESLVNARMNSEDLAAFCTVNSEGRTLLKRAMQKFGLSARAHDRILKMARTIADLAGSEAIDPAHVAEAVQYRCLDRGD